MSLSKKQRFEVFKRDNWTCGYCGKKPPECVLEIDHVIAKSKGGTDDATNLLTSCFECNRGKGDGDLEDKIPEAFTDAEMKRLQDLLERRAAAKRIANLQRKVQKQTDKELDKIVDAWNRWHIGENEEDKIPLPTNFKISFKTFLKHMSSDEIIEAIEVAMVKPYMEPHKVFRYFCGVCWGRIKSLQTEGGE